MNERGNWFVGWPVDGASAWVDGLLVPRGARKFHADDVHVTVVFLGACGEARARAMWERVRASAGSRTTIAGGPLVPFGDARRPSAYAVESFDTGLLAMIRAHAGEARPPRAHATLVRPSRNASNAERKALDAWARGVRVSDELALTRLALFTWALDRRERLFRIVDSVALR